MWASITFVAGFVFAVLVVRAARRRGDSTSRPSRPTVLGWLTLVLGLVALVSFGLGAGGGRGGALYLASIASATAAVVIGIGAIAGRDRQWPTWVGLVAGAIPALGWTAFAIGNTLGSGR